MLEIHLDPLGGIAGDMFVAALLDLRPDLEPGLQQALAGMPLLDGVTCAVAEHSDGVLAGRRFLVRRDHDHAGVDDDAVHRHGHTDHASHADIAWRDIRAALAEAPLDEQTRSHAIGIFTHLAEAEARVHATAPDAVHFHEVGAWDSIADIVAAAWLIGQTCGGALDNRRATSRRRQDPHRPRPAAGACARHGATPRRLPDNRRRHFRRARDADRSGNRPLSLQSARATAAGAQAGRFCTRLRHPDPCRHQQLSARSRLRGQGSDCAGDRSHRRAGMRDRRPDRRGPRIGDRPAARSSMAFSTSSRRRCWARRDG